MLHLYPGWVYAGERGVGLDVEASGGAGAKSDAVTVDNLVDVQII